MEKNNLCCTFSCCWLCELQAGTGAIGGEKSYLQVTRMGLYFLTLWLDVLVEVNFERSRSFFDIFPEPKF